jgi:hypothetical protein
MPEFFGIENQGFGGVIGPLVFGDDTVGVRFMAGPGLLPHSFIVGAGF